MKKIVFIIIERTTGGFTSALSSLYDIIKTDYDIQVVELTSCGHTPVSYDSVCIKPSFLCDGYYSDFTASNGFRKFRALIARIWAKMVNNPVERLINNYQRIFDEADCIIAYSEGKATRFVREIDHPNKVAWIHFDITHYPYDEDLCKILSTFNQVVCVADAIASNMKQIYPSLANKIVGIHNFIDADRILYLSKHSISEHFDNCFNIISLGRIVPLKRFSTIPSIALYLKKNGLSFKWRILGPATDISEKNKLITEIKEKNLEDVVEWLGAKDNPYPYIAKSDILVCTSETEACPMIFTEARVLNTVIVSTDFPSSYEFIEDNNDGIISPFESLQERLLQICTDTSLCNRLMQASKNRGNGTIESLNRFLRIVNSI